jgi:lipopolysaccharide transport system ATP-binding protein
MIHVHKLTKVYKLYDKPIDRLKESLSFTKARYHKDFYALKDINFKIKKGEIVGIIGKNGSGKSTLLKIITKILSPTSGHVKTKGNISAILELGSGFNPELSGFENIHLHSVINESGKKISKNKIKKIIDFADIGEFINQPIKTYSSGMKARLAFALAINVEPDILIVDEALSVGDSAFQRKCFAKMEEMKANNVTILFVSHSYSSVVPFCSRALWLNSGELILEGFSKQVCDLYMKYSTKEIDKNYIRKEYIDILTQNEKKQEKKTKVVSKPQLSNDFFDKTLTPIPVFYDDLGAKFFDVMILNSENKKINVLTQGEEYFFVYSVEYAKIEKNIQFGMLIKTLNGVDLAGAAYPSKKSFVNLDSKKVNVRFKFKCLFNEGIYLMNCSTRQLARDDIVILNRILDIYMFRVLKSNDISTSKLGLVHESRVSSV